MAERFTADLLFIIIALLVAALLGYLIGYFLAKGRYMKRIRALEDEKASLEAKLRKLEEEKLNLQAELRKLEEEKLKLRSDYSKLEEEKTKLLADLRRVDDEMASLKLTIEKLEKETRIKAEETNLKAMEVPHEKIVTDDLEVVIGIGPKIARILMNRGIATWKSLSETAPDTIREYLLQDGGERFRIHNPDSWPLQARLLHEGRWDEFREMQSRLEAEGGEV